MTKTISLFRRFVMFLLALLPFSVSAAEQFVSFHGGDLLLNGKYILAQKGKKNYFLLIVK